MELCGTSQDEHSTVSPLEIFSKPAALCHLNVQSLMSKQDELELTLTIAQRPVILGLSETWLDGSVTDAEVSVPCYATYRRDWGSRGGGVLVYVTDKCRSMRRNDLEEDEVEILWVEVRMNQRTLLLGNMFRPPNATSSVLDSLEVMLERAVSERKEVILMGDFNLNLLVHSTETDRLLQITEDNNLKQLISVPTRITNHSQTLIDLLFTTNPNIFTDTGTAALTGSDHLTIDLWGVFYKNKVPPTSAHCSIIQEVQHSSDAS